MPVLMTTSHDRLFGPSKLAAMDMSVLRRMSRRPDIARRIFRFESMSTDLIRHYVPTGSPMPERMETEVSTVNTQTILQGPYSEFVPTDFGLAVEFSHQFRREDKRGLLKDILNDVADAVTYHRRLGPAEILNTAFGGKLWRDGKTLCATDHPLYGGETLGPPTASNRMTAGALTQSAIELMITQGMGIVNEMGYLRQLDFRHLVFDRTQWAPANEILQSPDKSSTASRAINVLRFAEGGKPVPIMFDHLDPGVGFFLTTTAEDSKAFVFNREGPYRKSWMTEGSRIQTYAMFYARSIGVSDWRWCIGQSFS